MRHIVIIKFVMKPFYCLLILFLASGVNAQTVPERIQKGMLLLNEGKIDEAEKIVAPVIAQNPQHGAARFLLGQIAIERGEWQDAEEHLRIATVSSTRRPDLVWQLYGKLQLYRHNYPEAKRAFEQALAQVPSFVPAQLGLGFSALFIGDTATGLTHLQPAAIESPEAAFVLGQLLIFLKRDADAKDVLNSAIVKNDSGKAKAQAFLDSINNNRSRLLAFISQNLGIAEGYLALGILQLRNNEPASAVRLFRIAYELNDQNPIPLLFLNRAELNAKIPAFKTPHPEMMKTVNAAQQALEQGNNEAAGALAEKVLEERPLHMEARLLFIEAAENAKKYWDAFRHYQEINELVSGLSQVEGRFALLAQKMEAHDLAECLARKALESDPESGYLHFVLAAVLQSREKEEAALAQAEKSIALGFQEPAVYVTLGDIYYQKMEISKSISALAKAVEMDPRAAENIASFALSALTTDDYAALRTILEKHVQAHPGNIETLYGLAMMHITENELDRAKEYFVKLESLAPNQPEIYYNLALLNFRMGFQKEGEQAMSRFHDLKEKEKREWLRQNGAHKTRIEAAEAFKNGNTAESIRLYSTLVNQNLAQTKDWIALAEAYVAAGKKTEAFDAYVNALAQSPYNREALAGAAKNGTNDRASIYAEKLMMLNEACE